MTCAKKDGDGVRGVGVYGGQGAGEAVLCCIKMDEAGVEEERGRL